MAEVVGISYCTVQNLSLAQEIDARNERGAALDRLGVGGRDVGHGVAVFPSAESGARAMDELAKGKYLVGRRTANQLLAAPGSWMPGNRAAAAWGSRQARGPAA